ncbi:MAG: HAD-IC family P-type ATPase [bacterium]|nr:HAD-IC family P-type ATPase [bacterium]
MNNNNWYLESIPDIFKKLDSSEKGLRQEEVLKRFKKYGPNSLPEEKVDNLLRIFLRQFQSPLIYILFIASVIVYLTGEITDSYIIVFVLFFNAVIGTIQEGKAQNTLSALKNFIQTNANVLRDGNEAIIKDIEVVPGDILILKEGEKVPADSRIIYSSNLKIDEASLTGESVPIHKTTDDILDLNLEIHDQKNMVFKGTNIVSGNGRAIVIHTGKNSVIGKIAKDIKSIDTEIPLKADVRYLTQLIIYAVAIVGATLFVMGIMVGNSVGTMFRTIVSLIVSIIPEGLPIVVTLVLTTGVWRMAKRNALVKRLQAVEALGQANVIAVDKTGTITKNEMLIQKVYLNGKMFEISGDGYKPKGEISLDNKVINPNNYPELKFIGKILALTAQAKLYYSEEQDKWNISGDPTEAAMLALGEKIGFHREELILTSPLISEIPFDYKLKYRASLHNITGKGLILVSGAPEEILKLSNKIYLNGKNIPLTKTKRIELESVFENLTEQGLRIVALATLNHRGKIIEPKDINSLSFLGFFGMKDAIRPEAAEAIKRATNAGIKVVMITGDYKTTAIAVAREAGIYHDGDEILTGLDIISLSEAALLNIINNVSVFARVTPKNKLRIIELYRKSGKIIAMTGDGVNDAPSLVAADLGIAMGKIGTEVAKEASDIILLDDNFKSIVSAIEEGRAIYKTIKKVILYLFSTSIGEVLTIGGAILIGLPLPILPAQIIWLNLVTDGFLDVALAMEPKSSGLLKGNSKRSKHLVDKKMGIRMIFMSLPMMVGTLYLFNEFLAIDPIKALTISLTTLAVFQWFNAWNCRSENKSIFQMNSFSNKYLIGATITIFTLHLFALYNPLMQKFLYTVPLSLNEWFIIIPIAFSIIIVEEIRKYFARMPRFN